MKITKLLLLSIAVIFLSCSEDDPKPTSKGMAGAWAITAVDYGGTTTTTALGTSIKANFTGTGKDMNLTTTFNESPNTVISQGSYTIVLTTTMMGQTTTEDYPFEEVVTDGTWTLNGNKLTIVDSSGSQDATITQQTSTTLKMKVDVVESQTSQGVTVTTNVSATYTFKKK